VLPGTYTITIRGTSENTATPANVTHTTTITLIVASITCVDATTNSGFDGTIDAYGVNGGGVFPYGLVVPQLKEDASGNLIAGPGGNLLAGSNTFKMKITPSVPNCSLQSEDTSIVALEGASGGSLAVSDGTTVTVDAASLGVAKLHAYLGTNDLGAIVESNVSPQLIVNINIGYVTDSTGLYHTSRSTTDAQAAITGMNQVWGPQANIYFSEHAVASITPTQALCTDSANPGTVPDTNDTFDTLHNTNDTFDPLHTVPYGSPPVHNMYFVWKTGPSSLTGHDTWGFASDKTHNDCVIGDDANLIQASSHELGHNFKLQHVGPNSGDPTAQPPKPAQWPDDNLNLMRTPNDTGLRIQYNQFLLAFQNTQL
jgi:hypothetical protein